MGKMHERLSPNRHSRRFAPRNSATVAIHDTEAPFAYGVVTNISSSGACVVTTTPLQAGSTVFLRVSFYRQPEMLETRARIVWSRENEVSSPPRDPMDGLLFHGVQFFGVGTRQRSMLHQLLDSPEFQLVFAPGSGEFESLMTELGDDLKQLGVKFGKETGASE